MNRQSANSWCRTNGDSASAQIDGFIPGCSNLPLKVDSVRAITAHDHISWHGDGVCPEIHGPIGGCRNASLDENRVGGGRAEVNSVTASLAQKNIAIKGCDARHRESAGCSNS